MALMPLSIMAQSKIVPNWQIDPDKELNPNTQWLREAKWGLFVHYLANRSEGVSQEILSKRWNEKVNSFQVEAFADQLEELKVPYFFLTLGRPDYYCAPNETFERLFGHSEGLLTERDLVADLGKELNSRGIKLGIYLGAVGRDESVEKQQKYQEVIREWSKRWGKLVSAWWIDGAAYQGPEVYKAFTEAYKSGNPKAIVAYNVGPVGMSRQQLVPVTEHEDYMAGEVDFVLPTSADIPQGLVGRRIFNMYETTNFYRGPNILGNQLHFLNFLGAWWGRGEPRFSDDLVIAWTKHIIKNNGAVTWDLPISDDGIIPEAYYKQVKALSDSMNFKK